ncbi:MAG: Crp/Fnr family transcriptional regulator [Xanthobacteraceae bacterium]
MAHSPNRLLASLPAKIFAALQPHLKVVNLKLGDVLAEAGGSVKRVYFPHSGAISLVVEMSVGDMIETAMVGKDGVLNGASALDGKVSLNKGLVQLAGVASVVDADRLRTIADDNSAFRSIIIRHEQVLFAQSQQSAACNASHSVERRMCRWILRMRDLAESDQLTLTQEFLAQMIGVRRSSVSIVAGTLQKARLIQYRRGNIRILDVEGLREGCCECYGAVKAHYDRLFSR